MRSNLAKFRIVLTAIFAFALFSVCAADSPVGTWKGRWSSATTGHSGPLRARIWADGTGGYQARFSGRFALVVPFTYKANLVPDGYGNLVSSRRMPIVGTYRTSAQVFGNQFRASYSGGRERGQFRMSRRR